jgi:peptidoglycan/LPS O-acetylase OafA/YrhL
VRHRADIDGLRAIAVVPVVLFHAGVSQVSGGFVGVDIFFVISGYLITSLILGEMAEGRFSLADFYERRIRRIFPALFAVLAVCVVLAAILFLPRELKSFDRSLLATTVFVSNIYFYSGLGYFAAPPDTLPLLHTWSLAIEEQFYIVFPLLLSLVITFGRRVWVGLIAVLFLLSLAASIWVSRVNPDAAFYLAPMRAWELMLGALLAARILPRIESQAVREMLAVAGIALLARGAGCPQRRPIRRRQ